MGQEELLEKKDIKINLISVIKFCIDVIAIFFLIIFLISIINPQYGSGKMKPTQLKYSCFSNIGNFYRAIEKYNTDHTSKINKMDKDTYNILVDNKYIKPITLPLSLCEYVSKGDLATDTGIIYCECHGDLDGKIKGKYSESEIDKAYVIRDKQR